MPNPPPDFLQAVLDAGGWSETAEDNGGGERLQVEAVRAIVRVRAAEPKSEDALAGLGVLVLTLSVAEWGIAWTGPAPPDPAGRDWDGPASIREGKHLMSYALGGIGLPHLDVGGAERFLDEVARRVPASAGDLDMFTKPKGSFRYDMVRGAGGVRAANPKSAVLMNDLDGVPFRHDAATFGGASYCSRFNPGGRLDAEAWRRLRHWCCVALRRRDMQEWIILDWLDHVWRKALAEVVRRPHGTIREALVVARIWNSSKGAALEALDAAASETDPDRRIAVELRKYGEGSETRRRRAGVMQRPSTAYAFLE
jgi:hypothetical protein